MSCRGPVHSTGPTSVPADGNAWSASVQASTPEEIGPFSSRHWRRGIDWGVWLRPGRAGHRRSDVGVSRYEEGASSASSGTAEKNSAGGGVRSTSLGSHARRRSSAVRRSPASKTRVVQQNSTMIPLGSLV